MNDNYQFTLSADDKTINAFNSVNKNLKKTEGNFNRFSKRTGNSIGGVSRSAGQASIQVQQMVGQIQGGVNPMIALSQQGADLGIVLGAPLIGSIVGIGAALGVSLLPNLFKATTAVQDLDKVMSELTSVATTGDNGLLEFTAAIKELSTISNAVALAELEVAVTKSQKAIGLSLDEIRGQFEEEIGATAFYGIGESLSSLVRRTQNGSTAASGYNIAIKELGKTFGGTEENARALGQEVVALFVEAEKLKTPEAINALQIGLIKISESATTAPDKIKEMVVGLKDFFKDARTAAESAEFLNNTIKKFGEGDNKDPLGVNVRETKQITESLAQSLANARLELVGNTEEAERLKAAFSAGLSSFEQLSSADQSLVNELIKVNSEIAENERLEKQRLETAKEIKAETAKQAQEEERKAETLSNVNSSIYAQIVALEEGAKAAYSYNIAQQLGLDSASQLPDAIQAQIDKLYELKDAQDSVGETSGTFLENMRDHIRDTSQDFDVMWGDSFNKFASGIGDATASAIVEGQNFGDTMKTFARSAIQEVISGLITIGVKRVALGAIETAMAAKSTAETVAATTTIAATTAAAMAPAAAATSLATAGTNSVPAISSMTAVLAAAAGLFAISSFEGGGYTGDGARVGGLDGKGGRLAMIHPQEDIFDRTKGQKMGSTNKNYNVTVNASGGGSQSYWNQQAKMITKAIAREERR